MEIKTKYVAEYNPIQNIFHIQTLEETIQENFRCVSQGRAHDYLLMGVFDYFQDANRFCDEMKKCIEKRNLSRPTARQKYNHVKNALSISCLWKAKNRKGFNDCAD